MNNVMEFQEVVVLLFVLLASGSPLGALKMLFMIAIFRFRAIGA